jgi:hypothetical protein
MQTSRAVLQDPTHTLNSKADIRGVSMMEFSDKPAMVVKSGNATIKIYSPLITPEESEKRWEEIEKEVYRQYIVRHAKEQAAKKAVEK